MSDDLFNDLFSLGEDKLQETFVRSEVIKSAFTWVGGKSKSIEKIIPELPHRNKWIDHFFGSGAVTFARRPCNIETVNDRYSGLINFYRCLQDKNKKQQLIDRLTLMLNSREEFYHCKTTWTTTTDDVERAAKWYYMHEVSVIGKGDVYGRSLNSDVQYFNPAKLARMSQIHTRLIGVQIECLDFEQCFRDFDSEDAVHYFDPPYLLTDQGAYNGNTFNEKDMERLLRCIRNSKGFCALSHYDHAMIVGESFWTKIISWDAKLTSEVNSFDVANNKTNYVNVQKSDTAKEFLFIKD